MEIEKGTPVLVTTKFRGVFFGRFVTMFDGGEGATLSGARNCISWTKECGGFLGLAKVGPVGESKIGPPVETLHLKGVTSIASCSPEATELWDTKV